MNTAVLDKSQPGRDGTVACGASAPQDVSCPLVSIVVPVWGAEKFLPACLDSIRAQTMPDWECILVDDGSPDNSGTICDEYAARDSRFVVIHKENGGVCAARNTGMRAAKGRYLMFCDSDDACHSRLLEWAVDAIQKVPGAFVCWRYTRDPAQFNTGTETGEWKPYRLDDSYFIRVLVFEILCNKLYDRQRVLSTDVWFDEGWYGTERSTGEDVDFQLRLRDAWCAQGETTICVMDDRLYFYRINEQSLTHLVPPPADRAVQKDTKGYWNALYGVMARHQRLYPDKTQAWPIDLTRMRCAYLRQLAYGLFCAKANGEKIPPLGRCEELTSLLNSCKAEKTWSAYYLPFRLRQKWLVRLIYRLDESGSRWFGRIDWGFYYLLGGNWNR